MSATTKIQWTDRTWNPVRGCSLVSAGCANCYAMKQAHRFSGMGRPYENLTEVGPKGPRWNGNIMLVPEALDEPLRWKTPARVFVNSMSDLFHEDVPDRFIDQVMRAMANTKRHVYQVLTKRPERMLDYLSGWWKRCYQDSETGEYIPVNPCQHIWFGVSVESQETADERIPLLLQAPAAVRFVSIEPLIGSVDIRRYLGNGNHSSGRVCVSGSSERGSGNSIGWNNLASEKEGLGQVEKRGRQSAMSQSASGARSGRIFPGQSNDEREKGLCAGSSNGVSPLSRTNTKWPDDQPREWKQEGQPTGESDASDQFRTATPCNESAEGGTRLPPVRRAQLHGEVNRSAGNGDQVSEECGRTAQDNCHGLQCDRSNYFKDSFGASVGISWTIVGGESGPGARPCDVAWIRAIKEQCQSAGVPVFVKQLGSKPFSEPDRIIHRKSTQKLSNGFYRFLTDGKGGDWSEWPEDLRVREFPQ